jgi:uncharacterized membrane protein YdbT with pleckstrin-like domain
VGHYVNTNLLNDETVVYNASISWVVILPGLIIFLTCSVLQSAGLDSAFIAFLMFTGSLIGLIMMIKALISAMTTELAVTSMRIIIKTGLIRRITAEMLLTNIEAFSIDQSIFGRVFGFGTVIVSGTGGVRVPVDNIDDPLDFKKFSLEAVESSNLWAKKLEESVSNS